MKTYKPKKYEKRKILIFGIILIIVLYLYIKVLFPFVEKSSLLFILTGTSNFLNLLISILILFSSIFPIFIFGFTTKKKFFKSIFGIITLLIFILSIFLINMEISNTKKYENINVQKMIITNDNGLSLNKKGEGLDRICYKTYIDIPNKYYLSQDIEKKLNLEKIEKKQYKYKGNYRMYLNTCNKITNIKDKDANELRLLLDDLLTERQNKIKKINILLLNLYTNEK